MRVIPTIAVFLTSVFCVPAVLAQAPAAPVVEISHVSGKPVPRFEALRFEAVNGRLGPSEDHRILWRYERVGLPVLIIKETQNWRRVRDPGGDEVWMHARTLAPADTALIRTRTVLREGAAASTRPLADIAEGVLVHLGPCAANACQVGHGRHEGWVDRNALWGAQLTPTLSPGEG